MPKKFEINRTKIKGSCQSGRKVVTNDSKSGLPLDKKNDTFFYERRNLIFSVAVKVYAS